MVCYTNIYFLIEPMLTDFATNDTVMAKSLMVDADILDSRVADG